MASRQKQWFSCNLTCREQRRAGDAGGRRCAGGGTRRQRGTSAREPTGCEGSTSSAEEKRITSPARAGAASGFPMSKWEKMKTLPALLPIASIDPCAARHVGALRPNTPPLARQGSR